MVSSLLGALTQQSTGILTELPCFLFCARMNVSEAEGLSALLDDDRVPNADEKRLFPFEARYEPQHQPNTEQGRQIR